MLSRMKIVLFWMHKIRFSNRLNVCDEIFESVVLTYFNYRPVDCIVHSIFFQFHKNIIVNQGNVIISNPFFQQMDRLSV